MKTNMADNSGPSQAISPNSDGGNDGKCKPSVSMFCILQLEIQMYPNELGLRAEEAVIRYTVQSNLGRFLFSSDKSVQLASWIVIFC